MDLPLLADRFKRITSKVTWTMAGEFVPKPELTLAHHREPNTDHDTYEFVKYCRNAYVEPKWGYVITREGRLLEESLWPNFRERPPWRVGLASPVDFVRAKIGAYPVKHFSRVICLRHFWEWNYYHFYLDVLGKLRLFDDLGIDRSTPILLGQYARELSFASAVLNQGAMKQRNWVIQDGFYISADEVYYGRTRQRYIDKMNHVLDIMGVPRTKPEQHNKVFLTRRVQPGRAVGRSAKNIDQVEERLAKLGFDIVDSGAIPLERQIEVFRNTRYLVALHGAGLTNIIFRRGEPMSVLEVHGASYVSEDFKNMCHEYGYEHDRLSCEAADTNQPVHSQYFVDLDALECKVAQVMSKPSFTFESA